MQTKFSGTLPTLAIAAALVAPTGVSAAGFALIEQSASGMGNAYAGAAATAEDASTIFFNPAGMSELKGMQFTVGAHLIDLSAKFSGTATRPLALGGGANTGGQGGDAGGLSVVPNAYFVMPIGENVRFGIGINAPFGLVTEYDDNWVGRFQGIKSDLMTVNVNPAFSFKVNDSFSIGAGVDIQRMDAELTNAVVLAPPVFAGVAEGRSKLKADDTGWGWNVGALWKITPATSIGAAYRSKIDYTLEGDITVTRASNGAAITAANGPAKADVTLPDSFSLSLTHQLNDKWQILGDATFTKWSRIQAIDIQDGNSGAVRDRLTLNFDDTWRYSLGVNYKLNDGWTLKGGVAYDQTPVKDASSRTVRLPDNDRTWLSIGAAMKVRESGRLDFGYSHLFIKDADINFTRGQFTPGTTTVNPLTTSNVQGTYDGSVDIFSVQYSMSF